MAASKVALYVWHYRTTSRLAAPELTHVASRKGREGQDRLVTQLYYATVQCSIPEVTHTVYCSMLEVTTLYIHYRALYIVVCQSHHTVYSIPVVTHTVYCSIPEVTYTVYCSIPEVTTLYYTTVYQRSLTLAVQFSGASFNSTPYCPILAGSFMQTTAHLARLRLLWTSEGLPW